MTSDRILSAAEFPNNNTHETIEGHQYVGQPPTEIKPATTFRIYCGNPNGFNINPGDGGDFKEFCDEMANYSVDMIHIYEHNLDTTKSKIKEKLHNTCRKVFTHYRLGASSTTIPAKHDYKPGGTMLITREASVGRITTTGSDPLGRWTYQRLACKDRRQITFVSAYQPCRQALVDNHKVHTFTVTAQQTSILRQQGRFISVREAFLTDLKNFISQEQQSGNHIFLAGDFNGPLEDCEGLHHLCSQFDLVDIMYQRLGTDTFNTHSDGHERIDYILCNELIAQACLAACYEPFKYRTKGDHRNMVLDLDIHKLFGNPTYRLSTPITREFSSKDAKQNRLYIEEKHKYLNSHNFETRLSTLQNQWNPEIAEQLDQDFQRASHSAAKKCKRKPNVPFIRKLANLRKQKNVLLRVISTFKSGKSYSEAIAFQCRTGHDFLIPSTLEECQRACRTAQKDIRRLSKTATTLRRADLTKEREEAIANGDHKKAKAIKHRMAAERTKLMYKKIRASRTAAKNGLNRLQVPKDPNVVNYKTCKEWIDVSTPKEIESLLRQRNQRHFGQAQGTFPTIAPFSEWIDWGASTHISDLILEGNFSSSELTPLQETLLRHMRKRTQLDKVPAMITHDEWTAKIKVWPEQTSTSPSGFHLTHSKALVSPHDIDPDHPEYEELEKKRLQLIDWQVRLLNVAITNGYSYDRWKTIVNVMILKEPNNHKIHRLRVIHLYEHDYNLILAVKWRTMIQECTHSRLINAGQNGGVPGRDAILPTVLEELQYEITRASKRPLVHLDYDATSCYDRIVMSMASLVSRAFGQHRSVVLINARTLQNAKYLLKTQLGISDDHYTHSRLFPIHGSGQGAGNSPAIWCTISSVLFDVYEDNAHGASFFSPDQSIQVKIYMIGFVDDTSGSVNDFLLPEAAHPQHYVSLASDDAQRWNDVLQLSGGALEDTKTSYHFLYYKFTKSGLPILRGGTFEPTVSIRFSPTHSTPLRQLSSFTAHKTLGVQKAPAGTTAAAFKTMSTKNADHTKVVQRSPFTATDTWAYYHSVYLPSICYPMPSGTLTPSQCQTLQKELKQTLLPRLRYNHNMPNAVVYGPNDVGGLALRELHIEQGIKQVQALLICLRTPGPPQQLAEIAISWAQLLAGVSFSVLAECKQPLPHMSPMQWLPSIRAFLASIDGTIELTRKHIPPLQREDDVYLMDIAIDKGYKPSQLRILNACRLFLQVTFLSDLVSSNGDVFYYESRKGIRNPMHPPSVLFPYQDRPHQPSWLLWNKFLDTFTVSPKSYTLHHRLGRWFKTGRGTYRKWESYLCPSTGTIWSRDRPTQTYREHCSTDGLWHYPTATFSEEPPPYSIPVDLKIHPSRAAELHAFSNVYPRLTAPEPSSFSQYVSTLEPWEQDCLQDARLRVDVFELAETLTRSTSSPSSCLSMATDGSVSEYVGSFGWVLALSDGTVLATNAGAAYGYKISSYRAECYGLLSLLRFLIRVYDYTCKPLELYGTIYLDSLSLVEKLDCITNWDHFFPNATTIPEWDLLQAIKESLSLFPTPPSLAYVRSHQYPKHPWSQLTYPAKLNTLADLLAGSYTTKPNQVPSQVPLVAGNAAQLNTSLGTITAKVAQSLRYISSFPKFRSFMCKKHSWTVQTFNLVDWTPQKQCVRRFYQQKRFITKYIHGWLPVGSRIARYHLKYDNACPLCSLEETTDHWLRCPAQAQWRARLFADLSYHFSSTFTRPALGDLLLEGLRRWFSGYPSPPLTRHNILYHRLITRQTRIGWKQVLLGRFTREWAELQEAYWEAVKAPTQHYSSTNWVSDIITKIWQHTHEHWQRRNQKLHGHNETTQEEAEIRRLRRETEDLYQKRHLVEPRTRDIYYATFEEHLRKEPTAVGLQQWLSTWKPVILQSIQSSQSTGTHKYQSIRQFFS